MKRLIYIAIFTSWIVHSNAQNLHIATWSGFNRTAYKLPELNTKDSYLSYGARMAFGLPNFQLGVEYEQDLTPPTFHIKDETTNENIRRDEFKSTYYGGLFRVNISNVPAYRMGLVLKAGAGVFNTKKEVFELPKGQFIETIDYDQNLFGLNASIGVSSPIYRYFHWELHYQFNYAQRPELETSTSTIPNYDAFHHTLQLGLSLNFVFGKALERSRQIFNYH